MTSESDLNWSYIINNLKLISFPDSLWGINVHPEFKFIGILHLNYSMKSIFIDKAIIFEFDKSQCSEIKVDVFLCQKLVYLPQISCVNSIEDICNIIFYVEGLKICENWQNNENCLVCTENDFLRCNECYIQNERVIWENDQFNDVDTVVKQILELEYNPINNKSDQNQTFLCKICSKSFPSYADLNKHEKVHHVSAKSFESEHYQVPQKTIQNFQCGVCSKVFNTANSLKVHYRRHNNDKNLCEFCSKSFFNKNQLKEHQRLCVNANANQQIFKCNFCGKTTTSLVLHQRHIQNHTNVKHNLCNICGKTFCKGKICYKSFFVGLTL